MLAPTLAGSAVAGLLSIIALVYFSEKAVEKITRLTAYWGLSSTFVGLTIFSVATSLPELFSGVAASTRILNGTLDYVVGSATIIGGNVGSDIFQQTVILGLAVFFIGRLHFTRSFTLTAFIPMILGAVLTLALGLDGTLSRVDGFVLLTIFVLYTLMLYTHDESHVDIPEEETADVNPVEDSLLGSLYLALLLVSAHFLLTAVSDVVAYTGLGGSLIGALTLGIAAASPELFTAYTAARNNQEGVSLGVLIGSNITNPVLALGAGAAISTYAVPTPVLRWDLPVKIISPLILFYFLWRSAPSEDPGDWYAPTGSLGRYASIYLLLVYAVYVYVRWTHFAVDL